MGVLKRLGSIVLLGLLLPAAAGAALAQGAAFSPPLDLLSQFAPVYGVLGLAGLMIASVARVPGRRTIVAASAVALIGAGLLMGPEFLRPTGPTAPPGAAGAAGAIKVIQINALRTNADIGAVADWLVAQQPDVVTITEARHDLRDLLVKRTGWRMAGAHGDLIIFTPAQYLRMNRPAAGGSKFAFVNASYAHPDGLIEIVTTHLDWPTRPVARRQAAGLRTVIAQLPRDRMILSGDFNATPWSRRLRRLDDGLGLIRRDRAVATFPAQVLGHRWPLPFLAIDHVYAGPGWATVRVERGPWLGSDHYPLIVTLAPVSPR